MIKVTSSGSFDKTEFFIKNLKSGKPFDILAQYGQKGVDALASATPKDSGLTASDWIYKITKKNGKYTVAWHNTNVVSGVPVVILLQYGHATGGGGWVEGTEFINTAIRPIFDQIANDVWREVSTNG